MDALTVAEIIKQYPDYKLSEAQLRQAVQRGTLPSRKIRRTRRIVRHYHVRVVERADVEAWLSSKAPAQPIEADEHPHTEDT